jgi:hypothetical protein
VAFIDVQIARDSAFCLKILGFFEGAGDARAVVSRDLPDKL